MSMWHDDRTERDYLSGGGRRGRGDSGGGGGRRGREWDSGKDFSRARDRSRSPTRRSGGGGGGGARAEPGCRVFVGNLPYSVSWQDLKDHMRQAGDVTYAKVMEDFNGRSRGCGIVEYSNKGDAKRAIREMHDSELDGRPLLVREDREDDSRGGRGGSAPRGRGEGRARGERREKPERGPKKERKPREEVTAEMLDSEMDSYFKSKTKKPEAEAQEAVADDAMEEADDLKDVLDV